MKIANYWLILAVTALGLSGLFTIPLMAGRTNNFLPQGFFDSSLTIHVNLDVLVWLLSLIVSHFNTERKAHKPVAFFIAAAGIAMVIVSPFTGVGENYKNDYIPIFDNMVFKTGLTLFMGSVVYESITTLTSRAGYFTKSVAALVLLAFIGFGISYSGIADKTPSYFFYENLFWGGGHIMQFAYVQIMLVAWLILAQKANVKIPATNRVLYFIFALPVIFVIISTIFIYSSVEIISNEYRQLFTQQMIFGACIAAIPLGLLLLLGLSITRRWNLYSVTLLLSILLFIIGGMLGNNAAQTLSQGETTIIPAHYHFSNVAITVALMGYIFTRLHIEKSVLCMWQIVIYTIGQVFYFSGMAIFGSHGAARKTVGLEGVNMDEHTKTTLAHLMQGVGGLGLIGGMLFVIIVIKYLKRLTLVQSPPLSR